MIATVGNVDKNYTRLQHHRYIPAAMQKRKGGGTFQILDLYLWEQCKEVETANIRGVRDRRFYGTTDNCIIFVSGSNGCHMDNACDV